LSSRDIIVRMVRKSGGPANAPRQLNRANLVGLVGAFSIVLAGVLRVFYGGQNLSGFLAAILAGVAMFMLFILYTDLRFRNATVYLTAGRVGITDAFGFRHEVSAAEVDRLIKTVESPNKRRDSEAVLLIVTKQRRRVLRFSRADRLEAGGVEQVAAAIGVPVEGSW
jgi:hypothetical protein